MRKLPGSPSASTGDSRPEVPMRRRPALALVSLLLAVLVAGVLPAAPQDKPRAGGELVFVVPSEPPSYDAHQEETFGVMHPMAPHYSTLLRVDPTDKTGTKPVGDLAESWTISKDGLVYTFKLRQGVKFHDGSEMTSKDVKASYDKIIFPPAGVKSLRKESYRSVEVVEAPDPHTVRFRPPERDQLTAALGNKITVQESPWDCLNFVSMHHEKKPFDDKRVRRALSLALDRYEASQKLSKITIVKDVSGIQVPGTPYATP